MSLTCDAREHYQRSKGHGSRLKARKDRSDPRRTGTDVDAVNSTGNISRYRAPASVLAELQREATAIVISAATAAEAFSRCLQTICMRLGWDFAAYWSFDASTQHFRCRHVYQSPRIAEHEYATLHGNVPLGPGSGLLGQAWLAGEPAWIANLRERAGSGRAAEAAEHGMQSALWLPIPRRRGSAGILEFFSQSLRPLPAGARQPLVTIGALMGQFADCSQAESALVHQRLHDQLTGLPNRSFFVKRLGEAVDAARLADASTALLLFDLNRFREVNDTLGHCFGDQVLLEAMSRVKSLLSRNATLARLSGDEFGIILPETGVDEATKLSRTILAVLEMPYCLDGHSVAVGASLGIAFFPEDGTGPDELLRHADVAIDVAKRMGGGYEAYDMTKDQHSVTRLTLATDLRLALENDGLRLYYQPMLTIPDGRFTRVEALVRWQHPDRGHVAPECFIPVAETIGLVGVLTLWVLETALRQNQCWAEAGHDIGVSVNLSARTLQDAQLPDAVAWLLHRFNVPPKNLTLEITEGTLMADPVGAMGVLNRLWAIGVRIAIDDFGTGYSSLSYLKGLPVHEIKIDKSFVLGTYSSQKDIAIVRSIIELGHNLGLEVVAEGVERTQAWDMLVQMGCDVAQGNLLGLPGPAAELGPWHTTADHLTRLRCAGL